MENMNLQNWTANNQKANPPPVHKLLSDIANLNLLEKYRARHQQIWIHDRQWQQRRDDDTNNTNNTKHKDWDQQH